jgi:hypothetical protein
MSDRKQRQSPQTHHPDQEQPGVTDALLPSGEARLDAPKPDNRIAARSGDIDHDQSYRERRMQNWLLVIFTGLILVVTAVYAYFSYGQWSSMEHSIEETRKSRELEYRAYVGAKGAIYKQRGDNPAWGDVHLIVINSGRTPIREGKIRHVFEVRDAPPPEGTLINENTHPGSKVVYIPQIDYSTLVGAIPTNIADMIVSPPASPSQSKQQVETPAPVASPIIARLQPPEMPSFGKGWYVYGIIDYKDIFEKWHATRFCFYIAPKASSFSQCPTFNDAN